MALLKYIKTVLGFGPFCQYPVAISNATTAALEATNLEEDEPTVSLHVKILYTKLPVEKIEIALKEVYSSDEGPEIPRSAMKSFLRVAATNVHIKCKKMCYTQSDGLAMGASLAVILANLWMKSFEKSLQRPNEGRENKIPDMKGMCTDCKRIVRFRGKGVESESCKTGFMKKSQGITDTNYKNMTEIVWICSRCAEKSTTDDT